MNKQIYRVRYRVGSDRSKEIIGLEKICHKRIKELKEQHGENIKFSRIVLAHSHPNGAPHV